MSKIFITLLLFSSIFYGVTTTSYTTTAVVTLAGAIIKTSNNNVVEKYKRKDCPVCKGKGWYLSGDGIAKINCQYCEP